MATINAEQIKAAASGRWPEILTTVGGIDPALLDGKHHPCPKCGGKDRFRLIDAGAGAVYCNQCFNSGNGDGLAAIAWMRGWDFKDTCREVAAHLGLNGKPQTQLIPAPIAAKAPEPKRADPDSLDRAYSLLLLRLSLSDAHREALRRRGFTNEHIDAGGYRTWDPADCQGAVAAVIAELGPAMEGIPGFHDGRLAAAAGLLIPARDHTGRIIALKVRPDQVGDGPKYFYVSAAKQGGPSTGAPPHVPVGVRGPLDVVRITEGELKADLATALSGMATISFPGAQQWRIVQPIVAALVGTNAPGQRRIRFAFDADAATNQSVGKALFEAVEFFIGDGYSVELERWSPSDGKGIDDVLAAGKQPEVIAGEAALQVARQLMAASVVYGLLATIAQPNIPALIVSTKEIVDSLASIDVLAICIDGGIEKWTGTYLEVLRGRPLALLVHAGGMSRQDAEKLACRVCGIASKVRIVELPDQGDFTNSLTKEKLVAQYKATPDWQPNMRWPEIEPLSICILPKFPFDILPPVLGTWVEATALATQTPVELAALLALAVLSACIARRVLVEPRKGWTEPTNLYVTVILDSGNRKSAVFSAAIAPLRELEAQLIEEARPRIAREQSDRRQAAERLKKLEHKSASKDDAIASGDARDLAEELSKWPEPVLPRLIVDDATSEKLGMLLAEQGGRIASMSPEGGVFDLMAGMYSKSGIPQFSVYLMAHSGEDLIVDRVSRKSIRVERASLVSAYAIQPQVIEGLAENKAFRGRGLLARHLYSAPQSLVGHREIAPPPVPDDVAAAYGDLVRRLGRDQSDFVLRLTTDTESALRAWEAEIERTIADGGEMELIRDWGSKLAGATLRMAAVLHCATHGKTGLIDCATLAAAVCIARYLIPHAEAVLTIMDAKEKGPEDDAEYILRWIKRHGKTEFTKTEAQHHGKRRFKKSDDIDKPLAELVKRHYIRQLPDAKPSGPGRPPSPRYAVNPAVFATEDAIKRSQYSQNSVEQQKSPAVSDSTAMAYPLAERECIQEPVAEPEPTVEPEPSPIAQPVPTSQVDCLGSAELAEPAQRLQPKAASLPTGPDPNCGNTGSAFGPSEELDWWEQV